MIEELDLDDCQREDAFNKYINNKITKIQLRQFFTEDEIKCIEQYKR